MPWPVILEELPPLTRAHLINGLGVAFGTTGLVARRTLRNDRVYAIAWSVTAAHNALARSLPLLPPGLLTGSDSFPILQREFPLAEIDWGDYLVLYAAADREILRSDVQDAVAGVSRAARAIKQGGEAREVVAALLQASAALARLHARLADHPPA